MKSHRGKARVGQRRSARKQMIPGKSEAEMSQPWWGKRDIRVDEGNFHMQNFSGSLILFKP